MSVTGLLSRMLLYSPESLRWDLLMLEVHISEEVRNVEKRSQNHSFLFMLLKGKPEEQDGKYVILADNVHLWMDPLGWV